MSGPVNQATVLREVQQHIRELEGTINGINTARSHLKQSAMEVKSDIQSTMTQQLEALRERECYLLTQVDVAHQAKDTVLQNQQVQLHQVLGGLTSMLETDMGQDGSSRVVGNVKDRLDRLKDQKLGVTEMTRIAFKANIPVLRDAVSSFGSVDIKRTPMSAMFDNESAAQSLPSAFEDYEDDDHHVLYRTIGGSGQAQTSQQVTVRVPQLSRQPEDWLHQPTSDPKAPQTYQTTGDASGILFPPFISENLIDGLESPGKMNRSESSVASIQQWLCDLQGQGEGEETDAEFEVISPASYQPASTKGSSIEVLSMEEAQPHFFVSVDDAFANSLSNLTITPEVHDSSTLPYFADVMTRPTTDWLLNAVASSTNITSVTYCNEVLRYFREVSNNTKDWLLQYNSNKVKVPQPSAAPQKNVTEPCVAGCAVVTPTMDIENLGQLVCVQDPVSSYFRQVKWDSRCWLLASKDEDLDRDEAEVDQQVLAVCKANEPCQTFRDCVCDENCCSMIVPDVQDPGSVVEDRSLIICDFPPFSDIVDKNRERQWLSGEVGVQKHVPSACVFPPFAGADQGQQWITSEQGQFQDDQVQGSGIFGQISESPESQWLVSQRIDTSNNLNKTDVQDLVGDWAARFCHKFPSPAASPSKPKPTFISNATNSKWLLYEESPDLMPLDLFNIKDCMPVPDKGSPNKTVSWLLKSQENKYSSKESEGSLSLKHAELPECEDEPTHELQPMHDDVLAAGFYNKHPNIWLADNGISLD